MPPEQLKSFQEALAQYHNGDYLDRGVTRRRHIIARAVKHIGKEANRWEEQLYFGLDFEAQTEYGTAPYYHERILELVRGAGEEFGQRNLARASNTSLSVVSAILRGKGRASSATLAKLYRALPRLEREVSEEAEQGREVLARRAGVDGANLAKVLSGRRRPSKAMLAKLEAALHTRP